MSGTQVTREKLPNGLTVLVAEKHDSPVVAINLWVRAGYFDEDDTQVGISHVIEHMFFKGTIDRPRSDQIATEIKSLGGTLNADRLAKAMRPRPTKKASPPTTNRAFRGRDACVKNDIIIARQLLCLASIIDARPVDPI